MPFPGITERRVIRGLTSLIVAMVVCSVVLVGTIVVQLSTSRAQNPTPSYIFANVVPPLTTIPSGADGIVVEGVTPLGVGGPAVCGTSPSVPQIQQATKYWLEAGWDVWTEISVHAACGGTFQQHQFILYAIIHYVKDNVDPALLGNWLGIMIDEESAWGFNQVALFALNQWLENELSVTLPPPSWWSAEVFAGQGDWTQEQYNYIVGGSYPAPEIATNYMVQLANSYQATYGNTTLVTWSSGPLGYPPPYNTQAASVNAVNGPPFNITHGKFTYYYSNQFCPGSCM